MYRRVVILLAVALVASATVLGFPRTAEAQPVIQTELVASGISLITDIQSAGDGSGRLFYVTLPGRILVHDGSVRSTPFLDVTSEVRSGHGEAGMLGLAFHPDYETNGYFFISYTRVSDTALTIDRYQVSADRNVANPASRAEIMVIPQSERYTANHFGGQIRFGPDGYLYLSSGDSGGGHDPGEAAENPGSLLGKMLRIDVNTESSYGIPPDNPWVDDPAFRDEIWDMGLRNPWRFSFDRETGDLYIADVGQNEREEVNFEPAGTGGFDYGWDIMEGSICHEPATDCDREGLTLPVIEYGRDVGCSVTGGFRYRGTRFPSLHGYYLYSDFCTGKIFGVNPDAGWEPTLLLDTPFRITTFGEGENGDIYVGAWGNPGAIYRVVVPPPPRGGATAPFTSMGVHPSGSGYWLTGSHGGVMTFGDIPFHGSAGHMSLNAPIVGMGVHPSGNGYWLVASDGGVFTFGNIPFHGSAGHIPLNAPIVGMGVHPSGNGYWLVASDGGVFTFGNIPFHGSAGAIPLNAPVVGMGVHPSGNGYWLGASDGGVFTYGAIPFHGSAGHIPLAAPVVGIGVHPSGNGYWMDASDGGIFTFGSIPYFGSMGGQPLAAPIVGMGVSPGGGGYWLLGRDGGIFTFGSIPFYGSMG